jgi:hypothetical protein
MKNLEVQGSQENVITITIDMTHRGVLHLSVTYVSLHLLLGTILFYLNMDFIHWSTYGGYYISFIC